MKEKADRDQIRRQNRSIVLQALRRNGPQARIDLGRATDLSPATVTSITSDLLQEGLIVGIDDPSPKERVSRGRPRSLLALCPAAACVLAIKISVNRIELVLADYSGEISTREEHRFDSRSMSGEGFVALLINLTRAFLEASRGSQNSIVEISIAAQGVVDSSAGTLVWSPALQVRNVPLVEPLSQALSAHCILSNDTNMIAEALHWLDPERYSGTFAVIFIDYGVGMGLYIDNRLFVGETGAAAEIGHANHIPDGALCRCGKHGCLEAYLGDYAILRAASGLPDDTPPEKITASAEAVARLVAAAEAGDNAALSAFRSAGVALGYGIARLMAMLDPRRIVLTGAGIRGYRFIRDGMQDGLSEALVEDLRRTIKIEALDWTDDFILQGTIAQAMQRFDREIFSDARPPVHNDAKEGTA